MNLNEIIKELSVEFLVKTPIGSQVEKAMHLLENLQNRLYELSGKSDEGPLIAMKSGTIFVLAVLKKIADGKNPGKFEKTDWEEIARTVSEIAAFSDNQKYSEFVFRRYADYIDASASIVSGDTAQTIRDLAEALRDETRSLQNGDITEVVYIDRCLWISLEAMIKLLASLVAVVGGKDKEQLAQAMASLAFEYGRYQMWKKEQNLLTEYLEQQHTLDRELEAKYDAFIEELLMDAESFMDLVDQAFAPDFRDLLMNSVKFARAAGVAEEEILDSMEKADAFFLD